MRLDVVGDRRRAARSTAACGENATCASMPARPRSVHFAESVSPNAAPASSPSSRRTPRGTAATAVAPCSTTRVVDWTKKPRQLKLVEPQTTRLAPSGRRPRWSCCAAGCPCAGACTLSRPAEAASRAAACVSAESGSPWSPLSSMMIFSRVAELLQARRRSRARSGRRRRRGPGPSCRRCAWSSTSRIALPRLEAHPGQRLGRLRMRRRRRSRPVVGLRRQQRRDRPGRLVAVDEGLRRDEAAREGDVQHARDRSRGAARSRPPAARRS